MLKSIDGMLISQFKEQTEKTDFKTSLNLEVGEPTTLGVSASLTGGQSFENLFRSKNWYCVIQNEITDDSFIKYNNYTEVVDYFSNIYKGFGVSKDKKKLALGEKIKIRFDFIGLDNSIGNSFLTSASCNQNIFSNISKPTWSSSKRGDGNEVWSALIEATVTTDISKFDKDKYGSYNLDFNFFRKDSDEIKLKAIATIATNNNPQIDVQNSPYLLEGRLIVDKIKLITKEIPLSFKKEGVSVRDFQDIALILKNTATLPNIGLSGKIVKSGSKYHLVFESQNFDSDFFDMSSVTPLKVLFDIPIVVGDTTINIPESAELYFPKIRNVQLENTEPNSEN
jgi:hypothetical protein